MKLIMCVVVVEGSINSQKIKHTLTENIIELYRQNILILVLTIDLSPFNASLCSSSPSTPVCQEKSIDKDDTEDGNFHYYQQSSHKEIHHGKMQRPIVISSGFLSQPSYTHQKLIGGKETVNEEDHQGNNSIFESNKVAKLLLSVENTDFRLTFLAV